MLESVSLFRMRVKRGILRNHFLLTWTLSANDAEQVSEIKWGLLCEWIPQKSDKAVCVGGGKMAEQASE